METEAEAIARAQREMLDHLRSPVAWMEMAQTLRYAADVLEARVLTTVGQRPENQDAYDDWLRRKRLERPAQMLYQTSYENAIKGVLVLKSAMTNSLSKSHRLTVLFQAAQIPLDQEEAEHIAALDRMNQLGRYRLTTTEDFGTRWNSVDSWLRETIDAKIAQAWIAGGGDPEFAAVVMVPLDALEQEAKTAFRASKDRGISS